MPVLYLIGSAAPPVRHAATGITLAQRAGWDVCLILTPTAASWLHSDLASLETLTGHPVRSTYKQPDQPDVLPPADALIAAPITLDTLSSWALVIAGTLALGLLTEGIGLGLPIIVLPYINAAQAQHPALPGHVGALQSAGASVLLGECGHIPHPPGHGNAAAFPWKQALNRLPATTRPPPLTYTIPRTQPIGDLPAMHPGPHQAAPPSTASQGAASSAADDCVDDAGESGSAARDATM
jgi:hypothetical protein